MMFLILLIALPAMFGLAFVEQKRKDRLSKERMDAYFEERNAIRAQIRRQQKAEAEYEAEQDRQNLEKLKNLPPTGVYKFDKKLHGSFVNRGRSIPLAIQYTSGSGEITCRKITMRELKATLHKDRTITPILIVAFCHLRNEERTFYLDSIKVAINPDTGEIVKDIATHICQAFERFRPVRRYSE